MKKIGLFLFLFISCALSFGQQGGVGIYQVSSPTNITVNFSANGSGSGQLCDTASCTGGQVNFTWTGTSITGSTTGSYSLGSSVTFYTFNSGGSTFSWGTNSLGCGGSGNCTVIMTALTISATAHWTSSAGGTITTTNFGVGYNGGPFPTISFGLLRDWDTNGAEWAFIETCGNNNSIATCTYNDSNLVFNFETGGGGSNGFDTWSANAFTAGVKQLQVTLGSRTPIFISSNTSSSNPAGCSYAGALNWGSNPGVSYGQCYPPTDVAPNGQNTPSSNCSTPESGKCNDLYFRYWVMAFGKHVTSSAYLNGTGSCYPTGGCGKCITAGGCAPVTMIEPFNEPDTTGFNVGSYDQRARMTWDLAQLYEGDAGWTMAVASVNGSGVYVVSNFNTLPNGASGTYKPSGYYVGYHVNITGCPGGTVTNGVIAASTGSGSTGTFTITGSTTSGSCTSGLATLVNPYTGETAAQVQTSVGLSGPITSLGGPSLVSILTNSYHPQGAASMTKLDCELYCSGGSCNSGTTTGGITQSCSIGSSALQTVMNMHDKPGNDFPWTLENDFDNVVIGLLAGALDVQEQAKPVYGPEAAYTAKGWNEFNGTTNPSCNPPSGSQSGPPWCNYNDAGMQASYIPRLYIYSYGSADWTSTTYYNWKNNLGSTLANLSYTNTYNKMVGSSPLTCSKSAPGTATYGGASTNEAVHTYTCTYTDPSGNASAFIWDNSQYFQGNSTSSTIAGGGTATTQTVGSTYLSWTPLVSEILNGTTYCATGDTACHTSTGTGPGYAIPQTGGSAHTMPIGIGIAKLCTVAAGSCN